MKKKPAMALGLLDYLAYEAGCLYLSDLLNPYYWPSVRQALQRLDSRMYSLWEWNDAAEYLTGGTHMYTQSVQARQDLLSFLSERSQNFVDNQH